MKISKRAQHRKRSYRALTIFKIVGFFGPSTGSFGSIGDKFTIAGVRSLCKQKSYKNKNHLGRLF